MRIHFIAIGGSAMHNLAIALHLNGHKISGSDDEVYDPARKRLQNYGLLPEKIGWDPAKINLNLDRVILGMHARENNPELIKAKELDIPVLSYPEFLYEHSDKKTRVVIAGSHGKTTTTAMILHVLKARGMNADYLVGAQLEGFNNMVRLSDAPVIILEGDEYLSSALDRRPKIFHYKPHIAVITGIAWDHINVFPTEEIYIQQFIKFIDLIEKGGKLFWYSRDQKMAALKPNFPNDIEAQGYDTPSFINGDHGIGVSYKNVEYPVSIIGRHNLRNLEAARLVCQELGIGHVDFFGAIRSFKGASRRLERVAWNNHSNIYLDFAHAPSKVKATVEAIADFYPGKRIIACLELHTYSSLNEKFLKEYAGSLNKAGEAIVFYNAHTIEMKKMPPLGEEVVSSAFKLPGLKVYSDTKSMHDFLFKLQLDNAVLLLMTSGNFGKLDLKKLAQQILI